jgi:flagellar protein FlaG
MQIEPINVLANAIRQTEPVTAQPVRVVRPVVQKSEPAAEDTVSVHSSAASRFAIHVDPTTKEIVVQLIDENTGEVIRQIPSAEMLRLAQAINEELAKQNQHQL